MVNGETSAAQYAPLLLGRNGGNVMGLTADPAAEDGPPVGRLLPHWGRGEFKLSCKKFRAKVETADC